MKKNRPYYLKMYRDWMKTGKLPGGWWGLCGAITGGHGRDALLDLFEPSRREENELQKERTSVMCWGEDEFAQHGVFSNRRQTILLFMAAMNNEL